jgi:hypothetical protein
MPTSRLPLQRREIAGEKEPSGLTEREREPQREGEREREAD